jgi:hypothetical protein
MRVLVMSRARTPGAHVRLLGNIGAGLADRGATVAYAASDVDSVLQLLAPGDADNVHRLRGKSALQMLASTRKTMKSFKPEVVLVDGERDTFAAALASEGRVGIVRRLRPTQDAQYGWRSRVSARLSKVVLLVPSSGETMALPREVRTVRAPVALPDQARSRPQLSWEDEETPATIACIPDERGAAASFCLRAFARLRQRRPDLTLMLLGDPSRMQSVRIHAAALGLTDHIRTLPESALFERQQLDVAAVWVASRGDDGALAAVASMARGLPVIVERNNDVAAFVAHRITGLHADEADLSATIASIALLLADPLALRSTREAAVARAQRLHSWSGFLDKVVEAIEIVRSDQGTSRSGARS